MAFVLGLGLLVGPAPSADAATARGPVPGTGAKPIGRVHLEAFENVNILQVVDASNRIARRIQFAGNPDVRKPDLCHTQGGSR